MKVQALTQKQMREAARFYAAANGNVLAATRLSGLTRNQMCCRLRAHVDRIGPLPVVTAIDRGVEKRGRDLRELENLRLENRLLREGLREKGKAPNIPRPKMRPRKDRDITRVIIPDSHGSYIDPSAWAAFLADLKTLDPDEIVGLGDHVDAGGFLAQHHTLGYVSQLDEVSWCDDLAAWRSQLDQVMTAAPRAKITLLEGNHEQRVEKWAVQQTLGNRKDAQMLMEAMAPQYRLDYKGRGIDYVKYGELRDGMATRGAIRLGKCYFTHGIYTGPSAARNHANKFGAPVVYGHTHTPMSFFDRTVHNGVRAAWNFGCLCRLSPRYQHNAPDNWGHGYGVQLVSGSGLFSTIHAAIIDGVSYLPQALRGPHD